jgi:acetoin utilization protein AcuB
MFVGLKMLKNFIAMPPDALVEDAQRLMDEQQLWMLFVVKEGSWSGMCAPRTSARPCLRW